MSNHSYVLQAKTGEKTVSVNLAWDYAIYEFKELYAKHKSNRIAKSGEILYLVDPPSVTNTYKEVRFGFTTNPPSVDDSKIRNIKWYKDEDRPENQLDINKMELTRQIKEDDNTTTFVEAGNPTSLTEGIKVQWVDGYSKDYKVVSPAVQNALKELSKYVNKIGTVLHKIDKSGKLEFKIYFTGKEYIEEDEIRRFYFVKREGGVGGSIDFTFKGFTYGLDLAIAKAELFVKPIIKIEANGRMLYTKRNDKNEFVKEDFVLSFSPIIRLEIGGEIGLDIGSAIVIKAVPFAGVSTWGQIKYYTSPNIIKGSIGIGKPYVGIKGELLVAGHNIIPSGQIKKVFEDIKFEEPFEFDLN